MSQLEITVKESLTVEEESERLRLERKVERAFIEAGLALQVLRDKRLWRSTHYSFKEYCSERFGFSKSQSYRLIDAVEISKNIYGEVPNWGQNKTIVLATAESQLRPLKRLKEPEQQQEAWRESVERAGGKVPTASLVKEVVEKMQPRKTNSSSNNSQSRKIKYLPLTKADIGQSVRIKAHHALFAHATGVIVQIPNNRSAIVELDERPRVERKRCDPAEVSSAKERAPSKGMREENKSRELIDLQDLEIQRIIQSNGTVKSPVEGPNKIPGMGLDWYIRVDEDTFKALDSYAREKGIPTLGLAVKRLLE